MRAAFSGFLAANPFAGDDIAGTGGVRKVRVLSSGRGKRGGARQICYDNDEAAPNYALLGYVKDPWSELTAE